MVVLLIVFAIFYLYKINSMTSSLCSQKEIPDDRQPQVFRTINILITILLISTYVEILFA
ncbi:hypothetical protein [Calidifontibacillus oryziterrae]|uniref:hypothetical protein n=1 Tax=Calidifontibacillus oryziterrae TaxID=1191699 RepID=UPI0003674B96|nr:hypothetical protein [Calidifontibacillus oryziterrae]